MLYLEADEVLAVLSQARQKGSREHCMFLLAYRHGLRATEIAKLKVTDVQDGELNVRRLKGSLHTVQLLQSHTNPLLDEREVVARWLQDRGEADGSVLLFTSRQGSGLTRRQVYNLFSDIAAKAGINRGRRNPHILKHSLASHLTRNGVHVAYVQQALGHRDPKSTLLYTHITDREAAVVLSSALSKIF
jgi:site-specific recombinase XerD